MFTNLEIVKYSVPQLIWFVELLYMSFLIDFILVTVMCLRYIRQFLLRLISLVEDEYQLFHL